MKRPDPVDDTLKALAFGALGGAAGTLAMRLYWSAATAITGRDPRTLTSGPPPHALDDLSVAGPQHEQGEGSTAAAGRIAYEAATGEAPSSETKETLSYTVHWGYGLAMGGLYGLVRGRAPGADAAGGLAFGAALWLVGDELMVSLLGLAKGPTAFPPAQHAHRLGAHAAYGLTTAAAAQTLYALSTPKRTTRDLLWRGVKAYTKWKSAKTAARALRNLVR